MKLVFIYLTLSLLTFVSCTHNSNYYKGKSKIIFYYRIRSGINDYSTYDDLLALVNYQRKKIKVSDLYKFALHYVDTIKANLPVSNIDFLDGSSLRPLAKGSMDSKIWSDVRTHIIISFGFSNHFEANKGKPIQLNFISFIHNSRYKEFYVDDQKQAVDSILNSSILIDD